MLQGKVKWYSSEKGYGYITYSSNGNHTDYFFHITSIVGPDAPKEGDIVSFSWSRDKKGLSAKEVRIISSSSLQRSPSRPKSNVPTARQDDRVACKHCGKKMVPRIQFSKGQPVARLCPFCMKSQEPEEGCFIATEAFGGEHHSAVRTLREFRDRYLTSHKPGRAFIAHYYRVSPKIAKFMSQNPAVKAPIRALLIVISFLAKLLLSVRS